MVRRLLAAVLATVVVASLAAPAVVAAPDRAVPKVVVVVGPSGGATDRYRAEARAAASLARKYTSDVTEIYSPNATWPAVRRALQGASLVIYMGHGNGWPSKYRDSLYPPTQNGFGLNPTAGGSDSRHQYFGEERIAESIELAKDAVVLLNHLCYASGNSEPGVPEGTIEMARQRVDNFAAGFIKAGASAVIAEAYASPNYFVKTILGSDRSIDAAWRHAPSANGNAFAFRSSRSDGYIAQMDPARNTSGFERSIVLKAGLAAADVLRGARGSSTAPAPQAVDEGAPSLAPAGVTIEQPFLTAAASAGSTFRYKFRYAVDERDELPKKLEASVRWDPLDPVPSDPAAEVTGEEAVEEPVPTPEPEPSPEPDPTPIPTLVPPIPLEVAVDVESAAAPDVEATSEATPETTPEATPEATAEPEPAEASTEEAAEPAPPDLGLVVPERLGDVVSPVKVKIAKTAMAFELTAPAAPGRYRLTVTLHDADGVAFDAATQALLPTLIVRVTGELDAEIVAPSQTEVAAGAETTLALWIANLGKAAWGHEAIKDIADSPEASRATFARVTGQWVALGGADDPDQLAAAAAASTAVAKLPVALEPGTPVPADLGLVAPTVAGDYLLFLDILTPDGGSLVADGVEPTLIRVHVTDAPAASPVPEASAPAVLLPALTAPSVLSPAAGE